jgi:hypothetical protein
MGRVLSRAIEAAGLSECQTRALSGAGLRPAEIDQLRGADLLLVAGLADLVRAQFRGDDVRVVAKPRLREPKLAVFEAGAEQTRPTGAELLREIALLRLATPADTSVAVSFDALGLELAQTALLFGADVLFGELAGKRTLPLLDGPAARRREIAGLVERSGRRARFADDNEQLAEQRP